MCDAGKIGASVRLGADVSELKAPSGDVGARLDRLPLTHFHYWLALALGAGLLVDSVDIYVISGVSGALVRTGVADLGDIARLAMATTAALAIGGLVSGLLADRFGRLWVMRVTMAFIIIGGVGATLAPSFEHLLAWRVVTALALGGETVLALGMLTEFMPPGLRGRAVAGVGLIASFGLPLSLSLGFFVLPQTEGWRWMLAIPTAAGAVILILRFYLVESPRWLAARGRLKEADTIVAKIEASAKGALASRTEMPTSVPADQARAPHSIWAKLATASAIHIATMSAVYGFVSWLPTFFVSSGYTIASSTLFSALMTLGAPVGTLIALLVTDRVERKWAVVVAAVSAAALGLVYALVAAPAAILGFGFLVVTTIYFAATIGLFGYVPELFPTEVRLRAIGFVSMLGRGAAFALPMLVVPIFSAWGQGGVVTLVAGALLLEAGVVALLGMRTQNRALERI